MALSRVLIGLIVATVVVLGLHRAGVWGVRHPPQPYPPTPAALATARAAQEAAAREAAAREEAERLAALAQQAETPEVLPPGHGREETFGYCTPCHSTAVIRRSRLSREQWDELMDWMSEKHGMNPLAGEMREVIVDYLAGAFPPAQPAGGRHGGNPFLTD
jgi:hypothetical protein